MSSWAKPGVKCVRVTEPSMGCKGFVKYGIRPPAKGQVLTIAEVRIGKKTGAVMLVFKEIPDLGGNRGWGVKHYRPLVSQQDDVAIFTRLLTDAPAEEDA